MPSSAVPKGPAATTVPMFYMVIEKYRHGPGPVYQRAAERGRMLPDGVRYVDSWVVDDTVGGPDRVRDRTRRQVRRGGRPRRCPLGVSVISFAISLSVTIIGIGYLPPVTVRKPRGRPRRPGCPR
jgi:hypothetical protein